MVRSGQDIDSLIGIMVKYGFTMSKQNKINEYLILILFQRVGTEEERFFQKNLAKK